MMLRSLAILFPLLLAAGSATVTLAAPPTAEAPATASKEVVRYRLVAWRSVHAGNAEQAKKLAATLGQLRCEVKQAAHGGHIDVRYRCKSWQALQLKDHASAHQWETWLKKYGFQTVHQH